MRKEQIEALKKLSKAASAVKGTPEQTGSANSRNRHMPGDIILLEAGDMVGADLPHFKSNALKIEEASLTGESQGVDKSTDPLQDEEASLGDRTNMAYKSTTGYSW